MKIRFDAPVLICGLVIEGVAWDPIKRRKTLAERGIDFADADQVFFNPHVTVDDDRHDYGEDRYVTYGHIDGRMMAVVWTERSGYLRVISMRKANDREKARIEKDLEMD